MSSHKSRKRIRAAKKNARPELKGHEGWCGQNFIHKFSLSHATVRDTCERRNVNNMTHEEFIEKYVVIILLNKIKYRGN